MVHGEQALFTDMDWDMIFRWAKILLPSTNPVDQMVFLDTETTGLAGGAGTFAFMVGIGIYQGSHFILRQWFLRQPEEEKAMLAEIDRIIVSHPIAVSYNGKAFDVPLLHSRFILNGFTSPFRQIQQIDLLHLARKLWKNRLASRTLSNIEQEILAFKRSEEEVPGWMAPELYYDYLRNGNAAGVAPVFYHNAMDIVTLGALLMYTAKILSAPNQFSNLHGLDLVALARLHAELGEPVSAIQLYDSGLRSGVPDEFYVDCLLRQADVCKKLGDINQAIQYLEKAADQQSVPACEELAKYYEHTERDYEVAIRYVNQGLEIIERMPGKTYQKSQLDRTFQHRLERLLGKWQRKNECEKGL
ncbi:MAG: ribonuclease H-like domain-containing protein [Anaerolineae bacterium]|nr:ribonuclease H-like domain-containing protein [Anaerolineae bacterium]